MIKRFLPLCFLFSLCAGKIFSQINLVSFSTGYLAPVDIKNCGDDRMFIVEQRGTIQICDTDGVKNAQSFLDIRTRVKYVGGGDERGLLGLAFAPDFLTSGYFYVNYVALSDGRTRISRFHVNSLTPDSADAASEEILLTIYQPYTNHKGGHLGFGPDGYLYIGTGDGGSGGDPQNRAQNKDSLLGKLLRIDVNPLIPTYNIPPTNPYADGLQGRPEIWAIGMRNPWRWSFDRLTGDLWIGDVGQLLIEEIDFQPAGSPGGLNYGWRCYEANANYNTSGVCPTYAQTVAPVFQFNHTPYCSVTGGYIYRGSKYQELYGKYFFTDYCRAEMQYLESDGTGGFNNSNLGILAGSSSIVAFGEDRNGEIYCSGLNSGIVYHLISLNCSPVATINAGRDSVDQCGTGSAVLSVPLGTGYNYLWVYNGTDTVSTASSFTATQLGTYVVTVENQGCTGTDTVVVKSSPTINLNFSGLDSVYCFYNSPANLSPNYLGGVFSGPGITGATFNPTIAGVGNYDIIYTYTNSSGCVFSYSQSVIVDACVNIPENRWINSLSVYPNPADDNFSINAYTLSEKDLKMEIYDVTGSLVMTDNFKLNVGENFIPVETGFSKGVYFIVFSDIQSSSTVKLVVR